MRESRLFIFDGRRQMNPNSWPNAEERLAKQQHEMRIGRRRAGAVRLSSPTPTRVALRGARGRPRRGCDIKGLTGSQRTRPKNRLSSPILGSQSAAAPAGDRDVAAISNYERDAPSRLRGYAMDDLQLRTASVADRATPIRGHPGPGEAITTYGHISTWDVSGVTLMRPCSSALRP